MIVLVNGPFGVGKTTTARLLVARIPGALLYDPERVGAGLRMVIPPFARKPDFQDHRVWRLLFVWVAWLLRTTTRRPLVIPMSLWRRDYFDPISRGLRRVDPDLACFRLTASPEVLRARILASDEAIGWRLAHLESGIAAMRDPAFGPEVLTDGRTPGEVAEAVRALLVARAAQKLRLPRP